MPGKAMTGKNSTIKKGDRKGTDILNDRTSVKGLTKKKTSSCPFNDCSRYNQEKGGCS